MYVGIDYSYLNYVGLYQTWQNSGGNTLDLIKPVIYMYYKDSFTWQ